MIYLLKAEEVVEISDFAHDYWVKIGLPGTFSHESFQTYWWNLIKSGNGFIMARFSDGNPVEAIGAVVHPDIQTGELTSSTVFWYITENKGLSAGLLAAAVEKHWKALGVRHSFFSVLCNENLNTVTEFLVNNGYQLAEQQYRKVICQ